MADTRLYARKLYEQELGYRRGQPGGAGRYFFISKRCVGYFPPLSEHIRNDHVLIGVVPPNSDRPVLTKYVYHNDKIVDSNPGGRNEFRLYLNNDNDPGRSYFKPDDIVVIARIKAGNGETVYKIFHFPAARKGSEYQVIEKLIQEDKIRGHHHALLLLEQVSFIDLAQQIVSEEKIIPNEVIDDVLNEDVLTEPITLEPLPPEVMTEEFKFTQMIRENSFRELLLFFYDYKCAITATVIRYKGLLNIQAAHIIPEQYGGPAHPRNGIPMSQDIHWAFDKGFFTLKENYEIIVHEEVRHDSALATINGKKIMLPEDTRAHPSLHSIGWHRENVYGLFTRMSI